MKSQATIAAITITTIKIINAAVLIVNALPEWEEHFADHCHRGKGEECDLRYLPLPDGTNSNLPSDWR